MTFNDGDVDEFVSRLPVFGHVDILAATERLRDRDRFQEQFIQVRV